MLSGSRSGLETAQKSLERDYDQDGLKGFCKDAPENTSILMRLTGHHQSKVMEWQRHKILRPLTFQLKMVS